MKTATDLTDKCPKCGRPMNYLKSQFGRFLEHCGYKAGLTPEGRPDSWPANAALRAARVRAHHAVDALWRDGALTRTEVYQKLSTLFGQEVHVAWTESVEECDNIITLAAQVASSVVGNDRGVEIRKKVRRQIVEAIAADLDGRGECLMKEVWEELQDAKEFEVAYAEMRRIIKSLETA